LLAVAPQLGQFSLVEDFGDFRNIDFGLDCHGHLPSAVVAFECGDGAFWK
jgi:hypothetical protein